MMIACIHRCVGHESLALPLIIGGFTCSLPAANGLTTMADHIMLYSSPVSGSGLGRFCDRGHQSLTSKKSGYWRYGSHYAESAWGEYCLSSPLFNKRLHMYTAVVVSVSLPLFHTSLVNSWASYDYPSLSVNIGSRWWEDYKLILYSAWSRFWLINGITIILCCPKMYDDEYNYLL